jgi:hypothetical protein
MRYIVIVTLAPLFCGCGQKSNDIPDVSVKPDDAFRLFAGLKALAPVPDGVKNLQASRAVWQDFTVCCRFTAPQQVVDTIVANGYSPTNWAAIVSEMSPEPYVDDFSPKWNPADLKQKKCYTKRVEQNHSTDILHLVVDRQQGLVYAVGAGSVHP